MTARGRLRPSICTVAFVGWSASCECRESEVQSPRPAPSAEVLSPQWEYLERYSNGVYATGLRSTSDLNCDGWSDILVLGVSESGAAGRLELRSGVDGTMISSLEYRPPGWMESVIVDAIEMPTTANGAVRILVLAALRDLDWQAADLLLVDAVTGKVDGLTDSISLSGLERLPLLAVGPTGRDAVICAANGRYTVIHYLGRLASEARSSTDRIVSPLWIPAEVGSVGLSLQSNRHLGLIVTLEALPGEKPRVAARAATNLELVWECGLDVPVGSLGALGGMCVDASGDVWIGVPGWGCSSCNSPGGGRGSTGCGFLLKVDADTGVGTRSLGNHAGVHRFGLAINVSGSGRHALLCALGFSGSSLSLQMIRSVDEVIVESCPVRPWRGTELGGLLPVVVSSEQRLSRSVVTATWEVGPTGWGSWECEIRCQRLCDLESH